MRQFTCDRCGSDTGFGDQRCNHCDAPLGYVPDRLDVEVLVPTEPDAATYTTGSADGPLWRCLNASWGCNWMLPAGTADVWCRSCRLTRGRPAEGDPGAVEAWASMEATKRRLVHQLDSIGLPVVGRSPSTPRGLAFDLVHLPGRPGLTGHLDGVVTLDLAETDERHRDELRRQLGEPFRTVIGHLRHEIGHYYWEPLVAGSRLAAFRELFGDERADYGRALEHHHAARRTDWDDTTFVSAYAAAHPLEDWAETFAHYLHVHDGSGTATAHGLTTSRRSPGTDPGGDDHADSVDMAAALGRWRSVARAVDAVAASLGGPAVYPFDPTGLAVDKLTFVNGCVTAVTGRNPFDHLSP